LRRLLFAVFAVNLILFPLGFLSSAVAYAQSAAKPSAKPPARAKKTAAPNRKPAVATSKKKRKAVSPRVRRVRRAFVASASLRPMAQQLLQDRTPVAYAGVEAYARKYAKEDAGALAWLVVGYAHTLDHDYAKAIVPFSRAKSGASEVGDYIAYYLGDAYQRTGRNAEALATLADFSNNFPDSLLIRDAHLVYANALYDEGRAGEAAALLEKDRSPVRSDIELAIGRAYELAGDKDKAVAAFRNLYFNFPNSFESEMAGVELKKLNVSGTFVERRTRADLLFKARHYSDAAHDYRDLLNDAPPTERATIQLALAAAVEKSGAGGDKEARQMLTSMGTQTGDAEAQRLYLLSETAHSSNDEEAVQRTLNDLRQFGPSSPWLEQALLSAGNMYLLKRDYDRAIDYFRELQQRFPKGNRASYAHWKAAWLSFRQGRTDVARQGFENQLALYPDSAEVPNALYWRARIAEEEHNPAMARAFYQKLSDRFHNYYYAELARKRLKSLPAAEASAQAVSNSTVQAALKQVAAKPDALKEDASKEDPPKNDFSKGDPSTGDPSTGDSSKEDSSKIDPPKDESPKNDPASQDLSKGDPKKDDPGYYALLDRVSSLSSKGKVTAVEPPDDNLRVERARLLSNGALADMAVRELQAAANQEGGAWAPPEMARVYQEGGRYDRAIEIMKRSTPNYFAVDIADLPRPYWEALFPKAYWTELRRYSQLNGLDPYLVASLIRQESEFNAMALSRVSAVGLMQLMPKTGKTVAKQVKLKGYNAAQLFTPATNLQLGTRYFKDLIEKYNGQLEYALAAYNAGTDRVGEWLGVGHYRDPQEFVESIPFTETREYVQAILRNANVYRQLYGTP
jgi:soluble lytic murein transglycosylase-like protein/TolA-binding protein